MQPRNPRRWGLVSALTLAAVVVVGLGVIAGTRALAPSDGPGAGASLAPATSGETITFSCPHGSISLGSYGTVCSDQTSTSLPVASTGSGVALTGTIDAGYYFANWTSGGNACLESACGSQYSSFNNPTKLYWNCPAQATCPAWLNLTASTSPVEFESGYAASPDGSVWDSYTFSFTSPKGATVDFFWTVADNVTVSVKLPTGGTCTAEEEFGATGSPWTGLDHCALSPSTHKFVFSAPSYGWVNTVTMALYFVDNSSGVTAQYGGGSQIMNYTMTAGGLAYVGVLENGGAVGMTGISLTTVNEWAAAQNGAKTDFIGQQTSDRFSFTTTAHNYGIACMGVY